MMELLALPDQQALKVFRVSKVLQAQLALLEMTEPLALLALQALQVVTGAPVRLDQLAQLDQLDQLAQAERPQTLRMFQIQITLLLDILICRWVPQRNAPGQALMACCGITLPLIVLRGIKMEIG